MPKILPLCDLLTFTWQMQSAETDRLLPEQALTQAQIS